MRNILIPNLWHKKKHLYKQDTYKYVFLHFNTSKNNDKSIKYQ